MAKKVESADWADRYTMVVAQQVRHYRGVRGMSAQKLSDACTELGHPIHRSVLANFENGRRANLDLGELFVIALALDVSPVALMLPDDGSIEVPSGRSLDRGEAVAWIAGIREPSSLDDLGADLARAREFVARAQAALDDARSNAGAITMTAREPMSDVAHQMSPQNARPESVSADETVQSIDAALEHLGRLDSETMSETEKTLAAALRSVCVAVIHKAADGA